jgi:hypothetical protein
LITHKKKAFYFANHLSFKRPNPVAIGSEEITHDFVSSILTRNQESIELPVASSSGSFSIVVVVSGFLNQKKCTGANEDEDVDEDIQLLDDTDEQALKQVSNSIHQWINSQFNSNSRS